MMMCWDDDVNDDDDDKDVLSKYDSASNHEECIIMTFVRALSLLVLRWSSSLFVWVLFGGCCCWLCV